MRVTLVFPGRNLPQLVWSPPTARPYETRAADCTHFCVPPGGEGHERDKKRAFIFRAKEQRVIFFKHLR